MLKTIIWDVEDAQFEFPNKAAADAWEEQGNPVEFVFDINNADDSETIFPEENPTADPDAPSEIARLIVDPQIHQLTFHRDNNTTVTVTAQVEFVTEVLDEVTEEAFEEWVAESGGWFAGTINLGEEAEPLGDDGGSLTLVV